MVHLATLLVVATIAACAASTVQVDHEWGWNQLLLADDLFDQPKNSIQSKGNDKALVVDELTSLLADKEFLAELYTKYAKKFGKEIEMSRMEIFREKLIGFASNNLDTLAKGQGPSLGITQFTDMTYEEFVATYAEPLGSMGVDDNSTFPRYQPTNFGTPDSVDWRSSGKVSKIKNQNPCGTCAIFSTIAAVETAQAIARNMDYAQDLSTQAILDCGDFVPATICSKGGPGTDPRDSAKYVQNNGIPSWEDYPYVGTADGKGTCKRDGLQPRATIRGYATIPQGDEAALQTAAAVGPVVVMVYVPQALQDYRKGVFDLADCKAKSLGLHAITVVGYTPDYWIIKNSWDTWWGIEGYLQLKKGTSCWGGYSVTVQSCAEC